MWLGPCLACLLAGAGATLRAQQPPSGPQLPPETPAPETPATETPAEDPQPGSGQAPEGALPVPEPGALLLVGTGLVGIALTVRRRRRRA